MKSLAVLLLALGCAPSTATPNKEVLMSSMLAEAATVRMQVERIGSGSPLALIGGGLTGWASWQPHVERLARSREVARLQLVSVAYGLEDRPLPRGYSLRMESRALEAALDGIGWNGSIDLVAWSYGAAITLDFALNHPERVRTLTLIEPPALWLLPENHPTWAEVRSFAANLPAVDDDVDLTALAAFLRGAALVPEGSRPESLPQWDSWVRHRRSLRNSSAVLTHRDDPARLLALTSPVLLVTGRGTAPFLRAVHDVLESELPAARSLELPGGHAPHLVAMDEFIARLTEFQASVMRTGGT
jgi:pimeloyl-ACP methyl ester carboxylesterase